MLVIARLNGQNGEISVVEEVATGGRYYYEAGTCRSYILPRGEVALDYVALMAALLSGAQHVLLFGCGGGALATELYRRGATVTVVDQNPVSFDLARQFFWMPPGVSCVSAAMRQYLQMNTGTFDVIGVDVGGPCFCYDDALDPFVCGKLRDSLRDSGRIAINIACDWPDDPVPNKIAASLEAHDRMLAFMSKLSPPGATSSSLDLHSLQAESRRSISPPMAGVSCLGTTYEALHHQSSGGRICHGTNRQEVFG